MKHVVIFSMTYLCDSKRQSFQNCVPNQDFYSKRMKCATLFLTKKNMQLNIHGGRSKFGMLKP